MTNFSPLGLESAQLDLIKNIIIAEIKPYRPAKIYVFGSRATGTHRKYSDLDLWLETAKPLSNTILSELYSKFSDSDLAIEVDIVTPETCLEEFRPLIEKNKKIWFLVE